MLTNDQLSDLADTLQGTCLTIDEGLGMLGLPPQDANDIEDKLLDHNCERCEKCGWWVECSELADEEQEGACEDCRN